MADQTNPFQVRTDAKLRYAKVHLDELIKLDRLSGDDFDRAHQESFLFHLFGARDAFLLELNQYYGAELPNENVSLGRLRETLKRKGIESPELASLFALEQDDSSWLKQAKDMRDHSTHVQGVPRSFFLGGEDHGKVKLTNPRTGVLADRHFPEEFQNWFEHMQELISSLRQSALSSAVCNPLL